LAFLLPLILYLPLPLLLIWLKPRLVLHKPGGSDLPNVFRALGHGLANGGFFRIGRSGWWENAKPSVRAAKGLSPETHYSDEFVVDVQRTMQATGMFCFFPVQYWNDNGYVSVRVSLYKHNCSNFGGNAVSETRPTTSEPCSLATVSPTMSLATSTPSVLFSWDLPSTYVASLRSPPLVPSRPR
jgi:hypothetical protein